MTAQSLDQHPRNDSEISHRGFFASIYGIPSEPVIITDASHASWRPANYAANEMNGRNADVGQAFRAKRRGPTTTEQEWAS